MSKIVDIQPVSQEEKTPESSSRLGFGQLGWHAVSTLSYLMSNQDRDMFGRKRNGLRRPSSWLVWNNNSYNSTSTKSTDLGKGPLIPGSKQINHANQSAAGSIHFPSNLRGLSSAADIHIYLIVLLVPTSGLSTADICMHILSSFLFNFTSHRQRDRRSVLHSKHQHPFVRLKGTKNPQLQNCIPCVPPDS
jgi:hypothetical protein